MANLGSIKTASEFYDAVMSGWMVCSKNLNVDHFISKYEDLVDDVEASMSAILDYLDIEWNQNVLRYQQTALERGCINTPSASQVVQPIYKTSIKKWLSYNEYFQDSMYLLDKWIDHWGY